MKVTKTLGPGYRERERERERGRERERERERESEREREREREREEKVTLPIQSIFRMMFTCLHQNLLSTIHLRF